MSGASCIVGGAGVLGAAVADSLDRPVSHEAGRTSDPDRENRVPDPAMTERLGHGFKHAPVLGEHVADPVEARAEPVTMFAAGARSGA